MLSNEIPMDALMALAEQRRARYTAEAERFRLARTALRGLRRRAAGGTARRDPGGAAGRTGTRVTGREASHCA